jgi:hypothetical protein
MRASGSMPRRSAFLGAHQEHRRGAVVEAERVAAVTLPSLAKAGRSFATVSSVAPWRMYSSWSTDGVALAALDGEGDDLVGELPGLLRGLGLVLGGHGELVLLLAGDLPLVGDVLGGLAHVVAVEGVPKARRGSWCR